ncbi:thiopeptide-type bacteriocin biosynthesis protein [Streptomyces sp. NPDC001920]
MRFADPLHHLRLRFKLRPGEHCSELATDVTRALRADLANGAVERLVFDTYDREIERFEGVRGIDLAEGVFTADSTMVLSLVRDVVRGRVPLDRTLLAVATVDDLLAALGLAAADREALAIAMAGERTASAATFRESGATLRMLLDGGSPPEEIRRSLRRRRRAITSLVTPVARPAEWSAPDSGVAASLAHLHCNRLTGLGNGWCTDFWRGPDTAPPGGRRSDTPTDSARCTHTGFETRHTVRAGSIAVGESGPRH